jgi:hypothetical protein
MSILQEFDDSFSSELCPAIIWRILDFPAYEVQQFMAARIRPEAACSFTS